MAEAGGSVVVNNSQIALLHGLVSCNRFRNWIMEWRWCRWNTGLRYRCYRCPLQSAFVNH